MMHLRCLFSAKNSHELRVFSVKKFFCLKIGSCNFFDKFQVCKRTRMRQRQSLWKATLCSSGWRMSGDLYLGTVLRRTTSCQLSTSERFIPEQAKGWKGQVWPQHLRWGRNLLLPPSAVCCNGGLGKEKAPASDNGWNTPLYPHLVRRYFPGSAYFTLVYKQFLIQMF